MLSAKIPFGLLVKTSCLAEFFVVVGLLVFFLAVLKENKFGQY